MALPSGEVLGKQIKKDIDERAKKSDLELALDHLIAEFSKK